MDNSSKANKIACTLRVLTKSGVLDWRNVYAYDHNSSEYVTSLKLGENVINFRVYPYGIMGNKTCLAISLITGSQLLNTFEYLTHGSAKELYKVVKNKVNASRIAQQEKISEEALSAALEALRNLISKEESIAHDMECD